MTINQVFRNKETNKLVVLLYPCKMNDSNEDGYVYQQPGQKGIDSLSALSIKDFNERYDSISATYHVKFVGDWPHNTMVEVDEKLQVTHNCDNHK